MESSYSDTQQSSRDVIVCLSPPGSIATADHWLSRSLPPQSRHRVYTEDGTPVGSTRLRRGRPNSVQSGLPSPLHSSLLVTCTKELAVVDTSPILSSHSAASTPSKTDVDCASVRTELNLSLNGSKVSTAHNEAFTESMLAGADVNSSSEAADLSCTYDTDVVMCPVVQQQAATVQSSTTSLDSAVDDVDMDLNIPRSFSKQSLVSHDSGVGLSDHNPFTSQSALVHNKLNANVDEGSDRVGLCRDRCRQSVRFSPNLHVSTDVRNLLSKAGMPLEAVGITEPDIAERTTRSDVASCETAVAVCSVNLPSSSTVGRCQSKLVPVLPISTNLPRVSREHYSSSVQRHLTTATATTPTASAPRIKTALLTPSFKQCFSGVDGTSQLRSRLRGNPVKRLQSSTHAPHSPVNPLSPRHVAASRHMTVPIPFDVDV